jgi:acyl-CoA reductase-like NAD-dependent aldehyde dehydrogenase
LEIIERSRLTGNEIGKYKVPAPAEIKELVERSKEAFKSWENTDIGERRSYLKKFREYLVLNMEHIISYISESTGKVPLEALTSDLLSTLEFVKYYERNSGKILRTEKRKTPLILFNNSSWVEYSPLGSVFVICPWNYPLQLTLVPAVCALTAGNTVIIKPSEVTPGIGKIIEDMCRFAGIPRDVIIIAQGGKETVENVISAVPDKVFFTGSVSTGQKIMELCSKNLIPVDLELGCKDAMLVFADSDLNRALSGALYGAFANSGQMCVAAKRIYVEAPVYDEFALRFSKMADELKVGSGAGHDLGPVTLDKSIELVQKHYEEAVSKGAKPLNEFKKDGSFIRPIIMKDVTRDMKLASEETFGPIVPVMPFKDETDGIRLANDSEYGLNASVWSKDLRKARRVASKIKAGNVYINDVSKNIGNPYLPFGGIKKSGSGRYHGPEGLYAFSNVKAVMLNRNKGKELNWFPYSSKLYSDIMMLIRTFYGKLPVLNKIKNLFYLGGILKRK